MNQSPSRYTSMLLLLVGLLGAGNAMADEIVTYTFDGVFASVGYKTSLYTPGAAFSLSFALPEKPAETPGSGFSYPGTVFTSDFSVTAASTLTIGGSPINLAPVDFGFYNGDTDGGGFAVMLVNGTDTLYLTTGGDGLFTETDDPNMLDGSFDVDARYSYYDVNGIVANRFDSTPTMMGVLSTTSQVPEPATVALLGLGLAGGAVARRRRR